MLQFALAAAILATTPSPAPTATMIASPATGPSQSITWNGITIGEPSAALRATLGDPLRKISGKSIDVARYWMPGSKSSYFLAIEESGRVVGFSAFSEPDGTVENVPPDPSGVRIGDSRESVQAKHPDFASGHDDDNDPTLEGRVGDFYVFYRLAGDRVANFHWGRPFNPVATPPLTENPEPTGDSFDDAVLDVQANEMDGTAWEYRYLAFHPCADGVEWKPATQSLVHNAGRAYDILHVVCPATNAERDFYFDITPYFGKL
jgi:hypothetical protein